MNIIVEQNFGLCHARARTLLKERSALVDSGTWQSVTTKGRPEMITHELEDVVLQFPIFTEDLDYHRNQSKPNLPWADEHFEKDRVSGEPLNPGHTWQDWPYANKADEFRHIVNFPDSEPQFNHSYAERYWPRFAGFRPNGKLDQLDLKAEGRWGIRYRYGDLNDLIDLLVKNPSTRAAYLPIFFPEDTGMVHGGRTPCSLGYLFRMRERRLGIAYDIRSCDFVRHFEDDVYLTVRLLLWVLDQCRKKDLARWKSIVPGTFFMHIGSLHMFRNDYIKLFNHSPGPVR